MSSILRALSRRVSMLPPVVSGPDRAWYAASVAACALLTPDATTPTCSVSAPPSNCDPLAMLLDAWRADHSPEGLHELCAATNVTWGAFNPGHTLSVGHLFLYVEVALAASRVNGCEDASVLEATMRATVMTFPLSQNAALDAGPRILKYLDAALLPGEGSAEVVVNAETVEALAYCAQHGPHVASDGYVQLLVSTLLRLNTCLQGAGHRKALSLLPATRNFFNSYIAEVDDDEAIARVMHVAAELMSTSLLRSALRVTRASIPVSMQLLVAVTRCLTVSMHTFPKESWMNHLPTIRYQSEFTRRVDPGIMAAIDTFCLAAVASVPCDSVSTFYTVIACCGHLEAKNEAMEYFKRHGIKWHAAKIKEMETTEIFGCLDAFAVAGIVVPETEVWVGEAGRRLREDSTAATSNNLSAMARFGYAVAHTIASHDTYKTLARSKFSTVVLSGRVITSLMPVVEAKMRSLLAEGCSATQGITMLSAYNCLSSRASIQELCVCIAEDMFGLTGHDVVNTTEILLSMKDEDYMYLPACRKLIDKVCLWLGRYGKFAAPRSGRTAVIARFVATFASVDDSGLWWQLAGWVKALGHRLDPRSSTTILKCVAQRQSDLPDVTEVIAYQIVASVTSRVRHLSVVELQLLVDAVEGLKCCIAPNHTDVVKAAPCTENLRKTVANERVAKFFSLIEAHRIFAYNDLNAAIPRFSHQRDGARLLQAYLDGTEIIEQYKTVAELLEGREQRDLVSLALQLDSTQLYEWDRRRLDRMSGRVGGDVAVWVNFWAAVDSRSISLARNSPVLVKG